MSRKQKTRKHDRKPDAAAAPKQEPFFRPFANIPAAPAKPAAPANKPATPANKTAAPTAARAPAPAPRPQQHGATRGKAASDADEALTFERFMSGVTPLQPSGARRLPASSEDPGTSSRGNHRAMLAQQQQAEDDARAKLHALVEEGSPFEVTDDGRRLEGRRRGVNGATVRRMRVGELPIDARLDVQDMRAEQARGAVEGFVRDRRVKGDSVVLIVHGRGRGAPKGTGAVLRGEVAAWLAEGAASTHVAAFVTAPDQHGGEAAICVLLASRSEPPRRV
jgi:DNA-nicking Smr family endonuclease